MYCNMRLNNHNFGDFTNLHNMYSSNMNNQMSLNPSFNVRNHFKAWIFTIILLWNQANYWNRDMYHHITISLFHSLIMHATW